jgi:lipopolysaccharide export system permease protein
VGFALSLAVAVCYMVFIILAKHMNEDAKVFPHLLMWAPNIIFLIIGGVLFYRLSRK